MWCHRELYQEDVSAIKFCIFHNWGCWCRSFFGNERGWSHKLYVESDWMNLFKLIFWFCASWIIGKKVLSHNFISTAYKFVCEHVVCLSWIFVFKQYSNKKNCDVNAYWYFTYPNCHVYYALKVPVLVYLIQILFFVSSNNSFFCEF